MSRRLDIAENQVRAIIRAAKKEGVRLELKIQGAVIVVLPDKDQPNTGLAKPKGFRL